MAAAALLQWASAVLLNASFAWLVGAGLALVWLRSSTPSTAIALAAAAAGAAPASVISALRRSASVAAILCLLGSGAAVWSQSALMSGASLADAIGMLGLVLSDTAIGHASVLGLALLLAIAGLSVTSHQAPASDRTRDLALAALLLGFAYSRAMVSHAAEHGVLSLGFAIEWLHLVLIAVWAGGVAVAAWLVLPSLRKHPPPGYLAALSRASGLALAGIVATGLYNVWYRLGALENLFGNPYGSALTIKLAMVAMAVALGAYNKWWGFPAMIHSARAGSRVIAILRIESMLLFAALIAAALLSAQQPPASY